MNLSQQSLEDISSKEQKAWKQYEKTQNPKFLSRILRLVDERAKILDVRVTKMKELMENANFSGD